jgi:hypothetical protein
MYAYHGGFPTGIGFLIIVLALFLTVIVFSLPQIKRLIDEDTGKEIKKYETKHNIEEDGERKL